MIGGCRAIDCGMSPVPSPAFVLFAERRGCRWSCSSGAAALFAVAFFWPTLSGAGLVRLFAAYAFVDGALALAPGGWGLAHRRAWPLLAGGCIDMIAAACVYFWPGTNLPLLTEAAAIWAIALGATMALAGATLREADREYLFLLGGVAALLLRTGVAVASGTDAVVLSRPGWKPLRA